MLYIKFDDENADDATRLSQGRPLLLVGGVSALLVLVGLPMQSPALVVVGWVLTWLTGNAGISRTAPALGVPAPVKYVSFLACMMPVLAIIPLGGFLWRVQQVLANDPPQPSSPTAPSLAAEQARQRAAERAAARQPAPPPAAPPAEAPAAERRTATSASSALSGAVACVKAVGLGGVPEGQALHGGKTSTGLTLSDDDQPVIRATAGEFGVVYLLDQGSSYTWVNQGQLLAAGVKGDELHRIGMRNLLAVVNGKPGLSVRQTANGHARGLVCGGQFEASLVLLDALWDGPLKAQTPNGAVVGLPSRDICVFCDAGSEEGIREVRATVARVLAQPDARPLSDQLMLRRDGRWQRYA